jgi:hypothetical protein
MWFDMLLETPCSTATLGWKSMKHRIGLSVYIMESTYIEFARKGLPDSL